MKMIVAVALALVAVAAAIPVDKPVDEIIENTFERNPEGGYRTKSITSNGIERFEEAILKTILNEKNEPVPVIVVKGYYAYPSEDGIVKIDYGADENGYKAEGPSVPKQYA